MSQNHIDIQRVVVQSRAASMTALDRLGPSLTGRIRISTVICYASMHVEHINPNGGDDPENLCLVCPTCNLSKSRATSALDPITGMIVPASIMASATPVAYGRRQKQLSTEGTKRSST
jgi:hypothetical protein